MTQKHIKLRSGKSFDLFFIPVVGSEEELSEAAFLSSLPDHSAKSEAIYSASLLKSKFKVSIPEDSELVPPTGKNRMCGINLRDRLIRKGDLDTIETWLKNMGGFLHNRTRMIVEQVIRRGHEAVIVADHNHDLGVIEVMVS